MSQASTASSSPAPKVTLNASSSVGQLEEHGPPKPTGLGAIGAVALEVLEGARGQYSVLVKTLYFTVRSQHQPGAIAAQMYEIGNKSLLFLCIVMGFMGMILTYQAGIQTQRAVPDLSLLGATFLELIVRDIAASISALMLATRVGAGIAAEIGSMVTNTMVINVLATNRGLMR